MSAVLIFVPGVFMSATSGDPDHSISAVCTNDSNPAFQCSTVVLDQSASFNVGYSPAVIFVRHGGFVTIKDPSQLTHTFTLVAGSVEPHNLLSILNCGAPGTICAVVALAHVPGGVPPPPPPPPYPNSCQAFVSPTAYQCVKGGVGLANGSPFPALSTPFTLVTGGDSIILFPGESFTVQVTAPVGTILHFMCIIHPWMQGEIVVTS